MRFSSARLSLSSAAVGAVSLALSAAAQPMEASPEASFAGVWRVIAAKPAPWTKAHKLDGREAPLLDDAFYCMKNLRDQANDGEPNPDRSAVADVVRDGSNWLFEKERRCRALTVYSVASFAAGEFDVRIPYEVLQPYLNPHSSLL